jgi:hypothetical protein
MKAKIQTKSNYRNLNGQWLEVKEVVGTRVSCIIKDEQAYGGKLLVDFNLKEIVEMDTTGVKSSVDMQPIFS